MPATPPAPVIPVPGPAEPPPVTGLALARLEALRPIVLPIGTAFVVLLVWQFCCDFYKIPPLTLPAPVAIYHTLIRNFPLLMEHAAQTASEVAVGFMMS